MTNPDYEPSTWAFGLQLILGYLIFALTASSISMWLVSTHMKLALRGYVMSLTYITAAAVIYYNTALYDSVAMAGVITAIAGPWAYHRVRK